MQVGCALAPNTAAILIFRFLGGCFAASPLANSGAVMGDIWDARTRGKALALFTIAPFAGPALGPMVGGFIGVSGASWRWLYWALTMFAGLLTIVIFFTLRETYAPIILMKKAARLRKETGDERYKAPIETKNIPFSERLTNILAKPWKVLFQEPMLLAITIYMSFVYGCLVSSSSIPLLPATQYHAFSCLVSFIRGLSNSF
jgi:MFS family permease